MAAAPLPSPDTSPFPPAAHVPAFESSFDGIGVIDADDPLGLGELPGPEPLSIIETAAEAAPSTEPTQPEDFDGIDLTAIADMARRVEDARFAAESRLHSELRSGKRRAPAPTPTRPAEAPIAQVHVTAPPAAHDRAPTTAADELRALMGRPLDDTAGPSDEPAVSSTPATTNVAPGPRRPERLWSEPASTPASEEAQASNRPTGLADTASLLRELASLGDADAAPGYTPPPQTRAPQPPPNRSAVVSGGAKARRKGLFTR